MKEIAIITGGDSAEYNISIASANVVFNHLDRTKYNPTIIEIKNNKWQAKINNKYIEVSMENFSINESIYFDFVFMALHGPPAENGAIQSYFDKLDIPYSSCSSSVSKLTFNKIECNKRLSSLGFKCAKSLSIKKPTNKNEEKIVKEIGLPCFVKPSQAGSSFGISKVTCRNKIKESIKYALNYDTEILVEEFIEGIEVSCGVIKIKENIHVFPITEIVSENEFFDYKAKYEGLSEEITPARINNKLNVEIKNITKKIYQEMNLRGVCRIDFIIQNQQPYIIEINTIPGLSEESIIPKQAKEENITLKELFNIWIENTMNK